MISFSLSTGLIVSDPTHGTSRLHASVATPFDASDRLKIRQANDQQAAMSGLFAIAAKRYARGETGDLGVNDERRVERKVNLVDKDAATLADKEGLLYLFARTCEMYYFVCSSPGDANYAYQLVFESAMCDAASRLGKYPGEQVHEMLLDLKREWEEDPASPLNDYIAMQAKVK